MIVKKNTIFKGTSFLGYLTLLFIALKLAEIGVVATWSWIWVLSPLWLPAGVIFGLIFGVMAIIAVIGYLAEAWGEIPNIKAKRQEKRRQMVENAMRNRRANKI